MPTQNVNLTPVLEDFVKTQVALGHFNNASEVHRAALAAMARQEEERQLHLELLRRETSAVLTMWKRGGRRRLLLPRA